MAGISLGRAGTLTGRSGLSLYIPPKYRPLVGLISTIGIVALIAFLLGNIPQASEIFKFYIPAFVAVALLFITAIISVVKDFQRSFWKNKVNKHVVVGMSVADFATAYGTSEEIALKRLKYVIAIGESNVVLNMDTKTIEACAEGTAIKDRFIGSGVYEQQRKKLMLGNLLAFGLLLFAIAINVYYSISAMAGSFTGGVGAKLSNALLVAPFAAVILFATGIAATYLSNHLLRNSKADGTKFRKVAKWFRVINLVSLIALPILVFVVVFTAMKA